MISRIKSTSARNFLVVFMLFLLLFVSSYTSALGIAPSRREVTYEPGKEVTVTAKIVNNEEQTMRVLVLPQDTFASFVEMENNVVTLLATELEKSFTYKVTLPKDDFAPGQHVLRMAFIQLPDNYKNQIVLADGKIVNVEGESASVTTSAAIIQQFIVNVPYPESYANGDLFVMGNKINEPVSVSVALFNKGEVPINAVGYALIKSPTNQELAKIDLGEITLSSMGEGRMAGIWGGTPNAGEYIVEAHVTYGDKSFSLDKVFTIGEPHVSIEDISVKNFRLGSIAKFDVSLLSKWSAPIKDIQGEMQVLDPEGTILSTFETTGLDLPAFGQGTIQGYWDTEGIGIGEYGINVVLEYQGKTSQKLFETVVTIDEIKVKGEMSPTGLVLGSGEGGSKYTLLIILILVLVVANIVIIVYFRKFKDILGSKKGQVSQQTSEQARQPSPDHKPVQREYPQNIRGHPPQAGQVGQVNSQKTQQVAQENAANRDLGSDQKDWWNNE